MKIGSPAERSSGESRVALTPESAKQLQKLGHECLIQKGAGAKAGFSDEDYSKAGVKVVNSAKALWDSSDVVVKVLGPDKTEIKYLNKTKNLISFFWPAQNEALLKDINKTGATVLAMDMVPRISRAQKMDALSSMANIAGYRAVIEAGNNFGRFFTGQITAAGKVPPAKVLVIGAGVAGLAAIGTAQSLGAIVKAFDVRPEVAEQIESMGAEFLMLEFEEDGSGEGGYAKPASPEFIEKEMQLFREQATEIDIVITTALIPGRPAPKLWPAEMVKLMKPGSVVVDLAAEQGGNCDLTKKDKIIESDNGVKIVGYTDFPSRMAAQSSTLYSTNIRHMLDDLTPEKDGVLNVNLEDAEAFCEWLSARTGRRYRLPTEREWKLVCARGGIDLERLGEHGWYVDNADYKTHPVGRKKGDRWGIQDQYGNASEWCTGDDGAPVTLAMMGEQNRQPR